MDSSPSVGNDLSPRTQKVMDAMMEKFIHLQHNLKNELQESLNEVREERNRRFREEQNKRIEFERRVRKEYHERRERTLRENHKRREREEHERRRGVNRGSGSERERQRGNHYSPWKSGGGSKYDEEYAFGAFDEERRRKERHDRNTYHSRNPHTPRRVFGDDELRVRKENKRFECEFKERKTRVEIENQRAYTNLVKEFDRLEREDHERRKRKERILREEKELREKELKEMELKEQERKERKLRDEQEKELCDILVVCTNPCFVFDDSHLKDDVEMTPKEEIHDNNFLCEDVEEIELKTHGEVACDIPYKNPFTLVPSGELSTKFPWSTHHEENEAPMELEQPLEKICLSLDTLSTSNLNNIKHFTLDSFGIKSWIMIEFANLDLLIVPNDLCSHDVQYLSRLLEELKKEGQIQASTHDKGLIFTQFGVEVDAPMSLGYALMNHLNFSFTPLHCVNNISNQYKLHDWDSSKVGKFYKLHRWLIWKHKLFLSPCVNYRMQAYLYIKSFALSAIWNNLHLILHDFVVFDPGGHLL